MKKLFLLLSIAIIASSCSQKITQEDMNYLNGYWEIEQVVFADGTNKDYNVNEIIDLYEIKNDTGSRQKVKPQFDGSFIKGPIMDVIEDTPVITELSGRVFLSTMQAITLLTDEYPYNDTYPTIQKKEFE